MELKTYSVRISADAPIGLQVFTGKQIKLPPFNFKPDDSSETWAELRDKNNTAFSIGSSSTILNIIDELVNTLLHYNSLNESPGILSRLPIHPHTIPSFVRETARRYWPKADISVKGYSDYPNWPIDYSIDFLRELKASFNNTVKPKRLSVISLSHDVDTHLGQQTARKIADMEESLGFISTWFVVPGKFKLDKDLWRDLEQRGHEIACHGLLHDYKLTELPAQKITDRLNLARDLLGDYAISGFRSPGFYRNEKLIKLVGKHFEYDSSIPDTLCLPGPGGCGTVFPNFVSGVKQIPVTVPWDGELMSLGYDESRRLMEISKKIKWIEKIGGLIHLLTHPDPGFTHSTEEIMFYKRTLQNLPQHDKSQRKLLCQVADHLKRAM